METTIGEKPILAQIFGFLGAVLLGIGVFAPSVPGRIATSPGTAGEPGFNYFAYGGQFSYMEVGQGDQLAVLAVGAIALLLVLLRSFRLLYVAGLLALGTVAVSYFTFRSRIGLIVTSATQQAAQQVDRTSAEAVMGWCWPVLALGAVLLLVAAVLGAPPAVPRALQPSIAPPSSPASDLPAPTDFGPCVRCGQKNSHLATRCHFCGALLPWGKVQPAPVKAAVPRPSLASRFRPNSTPLVIDWGFWAVAVFSCVIPILGYFLYRSYSENGDEKAGAAGWGALLGLFLHVVRVVVRVTIE